MAKISGKTLEEFQKRLLADKERFQKELKSFAQKDPVVKGDWDSTYPSFNPPENVNLEEEAGEVEEYTTRLPIEHSMEKRLQDIDAALKKMKGGKYGICENCGKDIPLKRLRVYPEARYCLSCGSKKKS